MKGTLLFLAIACCFIQTGMAQSGQLDNTFGVNGKIVADLGSNVELLRSIVIQPDGKLVAGGSTEDFFLLVRYKTDGTPDSTFGLNGVALSPPTMGACYGLSLARQTDGKFILAGAKGSSPNYMFAACRFDSTGAVDNSFGLNGLITTTFGGGARDLAYTVLLQGNSIMYLCGESDNGTNRDYAIARYVNGNLDLTFGGGTGKVRTDFLGYQDYGFAAALRISGNIVMAGGVHNGSDYDLGLLSYTASGVLDPNFGNNGKMIVNVAGSDEIANAVAVKPDGHILVASFSDASYDFVLTQFNDNGSIDSSFGTNGMVHTDINASDQPYAIALQDDGKIILCGDGGNGGNYRFVVVRYNTNGSLDTSFSGDGMLTTSFGTPGTNARGYSVLVQPDGKIVVAGDQVLNYIYDIALARYNNCYAYFNMYPDTLPQHFVISNETRGTETISYLWSWGDGSTDTGATPSHVYNTPGNYEICLTITDSTNCVSTYCDSISSGILYVNVILGPSTGISDVSPADKRMLLYPNPVSQTLTIKNLQAGPLEVHDITGRQVLLQLLLPAANHDVHLNVSGLKKGMYFVHNGDRFQKFIKE